MRGRAFREFPVLPAYYMEGSSGSLKCKQSKLPAAETLVMD
jgi:hypothetical protein